MKCHRCHHQRVLVCSAMGMVEMTTTLTTTKKKWQTTNIITNLMIITMLTFSVVPAVVYFCPATATAADCLCAAAVVFGFTKWKLWEGRRGRERGLLILQLFCTAIAYKREGGRANMKDYDKAIIEESRREDKTPDDDLLWYHDNDQFGLYILWWKMFWINYTAFDGRNHKLLIVESSIIWKVVICYLLIMSYFMSGMTAWMGAT